MGCGYSKGSVPRDSHTTKSTRLNDWAFPSTPGTQYVLPCSSPWITPITRTIFAIPKYNAGDLQVQRNLALKDSEIERHQNVQTALIKPELQIVQVEQDSLEEVGKRVIYHQPEVHVEETIPNRFTNLQFYSVATDGHLEQPLDNADLNVAQDSQFVNSDAITDRSGALIALDPECSQGCKKSPVNGETYSTEQRETNDHLGQTIVESQTFVSRDQNGVSHLFNMFTIRHPNCTHDPLQGETHIQIMHKTPVYEECTTAKMAAANMSKRTSNVAVPGLAISSSAVPTAAIPDSTLISSKTPTCEMSTQNIPNHTTNTLQEFPLATSHLIQPDLVYFGELRDIEQTEPDNENVVQPCTQPAEDVCSPRYIVMGRATRPRSRLCGCASATPGEHKKVQSEPRRCCRLQSTKPFGISSCKRKRDSEESISIKQTSLRQNKLHSPNPNLETQSNMTDSTDTGEFVNEPLIQAAMHVPAVKCSHSRVGDSINSSRNARTLNVPEDYAEQMTNSSAHSDSFQLRDIGERICPQDVQLKKKPATASDSFDSAYTRSDQDAGCSKVLSINHSLDNAAINLMPQSSRYTIKLTEPGRHLEQQAQITPPVKSFLASEVTESVPNETIEEWCAQTPVQYLGTSNIDMVAAPERMRETKKSLKRAILDRIAGLRHNDVVLQSSSSAASVQNSVGLTACFVEETKFHKCDQPHLPKFELVRHLEQLQQHLSRPRDKPDSCSSSKVKCGLPMTNLSMEIPKTNLEEPIEMQSLSAAQLMDEHSVLSMDTSTDELEPDKLPAATMKTKTMAPLPTKGLSTTLGRKPMLDKNLHISTDSIISSHHVCPQANGALPLRRAPKESPSKKRNAEPIFLPPIRTPASVNGSALSSTVVQPPTTLCNGFKGPKRELTKANVSLPKLKSSQSSSSDLTASKNLHNTGKERAHSFSNQRKPPYDILVVHPSKKQ